MEDAADWKDEWLEREYFPLICSLSWIVIILAILVLGFSIPGLFYLRRASKLQKENPSKRTEVYNKMQKKVLKCTRGLFAVAVAYMATIMVVIMVDGYIGAVSIKEGISEELDNGKSGVDLAYECGLIMLSVSALFIATLIVVPLGQMVLFTWILTRYRKKHGSNALVDYIPQARHISTHSALIWATLAFWITAFWPPVEHSTTLRYVLLQACIGSASGWLDASFAFNFCYDQLHDIEIGGRRLQDVLRMFVETAKVVHSRKSMEEKLPLYEDSPASPLIESEKQ